MKICFLGTGHGVPEAHKKCTATLLQLGRNYYLIDAGCDVAYELAERRLPFENVKAVFITHPHSDHTNGLIPFMTITQWYYKEADFTVFFPDEAMENAYRTQVFPGLRVPLRPEQRLAHYQEGVIYDDGVLRLTAFPTQHCPHSFAFLAEAEGKRVLFSGDLKDPAIDFPAVDELDAAIVECAHFPIMQYATALQDKQVGAVYINHFGTYIGRRNPQDFKPLAAALPCPVVPTTDGMSIEIYDPLPDDPTDRPAFFTFFVCKAVLHYTLLTRKSSETVYNFRRYML